jgi:uncharacterized membrane protein (Fun14 family)
MSDQEKQEAKAMQCLVTVIAASMFIGLICGFIAGYGAKTAVNNIAQHSEVRCD